MSAHSSSISEAGSGSSSASAGCSPGNSDAEASAHKILYPAISAAAREKGKVTIIGFGSLLSVRSALFTFPSLSSFRVGVVYGYRRVFRHCAPIFHQRRIAREKTKEISSVSVEYVDELANSPLLVSVFEMPLELLDAFYAREMEFNWSYVPVHQFAPSFASVKPPVDPLAIDGVGMICSSFPSEKAFRAVRYQDEQAFHQEFGKWGITTVWRDDLFPCRTYLRHGILAAANMDKQFNLTKGCTSRIEWKAESDGASSSSSSASIPNPLGPESIVVTPSFVSLPLGPILTSFLDSSFLGTRQTSIRQYLTSAHFKDEQGRMLGNVILCTLPPEELKERYNG